MKKYSRKTFRIIFEIRVETAAAIFALFIGAFGNLSDPIYQPILAVFPLHVMKNILMIVGASLLFARIINGEGMLWTGFVRSMLCALLACVFVFMALGAGWVIPRSPAQIGYLMVGGILIFNGARNFFEWIDFLDQCRAIRHDGKRR